MDSKPQALAAPAAADLAKAASFTLGPVAVEPPARRICSVERSMVLEPRVMRVLVALGDSPGQVLTRDDLIELCWDGQIVSDKAISRAISLLRHALAEVSGGAVKLETVIKVGFRLIVEEHKAKSAPNAGIAEADARPRMSDAPLPSQDEPVAAPMGSASIALWRRKWTRRATAGGIVATGAAAALGYAGWNRPQQHSPDRRALELYRRGQEIGKAAEVGTTPRALEYYKQAVAIDPDFADAWAALALGYRTIAAGFPGPQRIADPGLVHSAAQRALELDSENVDAQLADMSIYPNFRHWVDREARLRAFVHQNPRHWYGNSQLAVLLVNVGRCEEAIAYARQALDTDRTLAVGWVNLAYILNYARREQEADIVLDQAFSRWPKHDFVWHARYLGFMYSRRYAEAATWARDQRTRPVTMPKALAEKFALVANAISTRKGMTKWINEFRQILAKAITASPMFSPILVDLGSTSDAFDALQAYYFGGELNGRRISQPGDADWRRTITLFTPQFTDLRGDPRFDSLLKRTGMEDYWQKSGAQPDFRRS